MTQNKPAVIPFFVLYILTLVSQLANVYYQAHLNQSDFASQLLPSLLFLSVLTIPALLIGFFLGRDLGIGPFYNHGLTSFADIKKSVLFACLVGLLFGAFLFILRWVLTPYLPDNIPEYGFRGFVGGALVSIGAAIGEEVWFRFGLMTLALWLTSKLLKQKALTNKHALNAIVIVAFLFGLAHLPQLASFNADTLFSIWATIIGNVAVSILFGWCFWRFGLLTAMVAHFSVDMVLHAFPALM